jgi:hypothetical protein
MRRIYLLLCAILFSASTHAACETAHAPRVIAVLGESVAKNERFKQAVAGRDARSRALRVEVERCDESFAMPCARRAAVLLADGFDRKLLAALLDFVISHENAADETVSEVAASVFAAHPKTVADAFSGFAQHERKVLLRAIESGWPVVRSTLSPSARADREARMRVLRQSVR